MLSLYDDEEDYLEPQNHVILLEKFWRNKMKHLIKIKNLVVTEYDVADYIGIQRINKFFNNCKTSYYKIKKLEFMKEKLRSLSYIELPPLLLMKNSSTKKSKESYEEPKRIPLALKDRITTILEEKEVENDEIDQKLPMHVKKSDILINDDSANNSENILVSGGGSKEKKYI